MKTAKFLSLFLIVIFAVSTVSVMNPVVANESIKDNYIILLDVRHGQFFNESTLSGAFAGLQTIETRFGTTITIQTLDEPFSNTNLQGADLLLISNPGESSTISDTEKEAVSTFVKNGGSTLYLSNPYSKNATLSGHPQILNDLADEPYQIGSKFQTSEVSSPNDPTILVDDFNNDGNETHIVYSADTITTELNSGIVNVSSIIYYGNPMFDRLTISSNKVNEYESGNASAFSYTINSKYATVVSQQKMYWILGRELTTALGRSMAVGSTLMFSDLSYDNTTSWIDVADNKNLFINMIAWLLQITPLEPNNPQIDATFASLSQYVFITAIVIAIAIAIIIFGNLILTKRMTFTDIFNFKNMSAYDHSKDKKPKSSKKTTVTTKKKQRRKRL